MGILKNINELQYEDNILDILKEINNELNSTNEKRYEIKDFLLNKKIICYKGYNKLTQKELIGKIEEKYLESKDNELKDLKISIAEKLISLLPTNNNKKFKTIIKH